MPSGGTNRGRLERQQIIISDGNQMLPGVELQKHLLRRRCCVRSRRDCSARFSGCRLVPLTDIRNCLPTMNGLSSYFEYGRGTDLKGASP